MKTTIHLAIIIATLTGCLRAQTDNAKAADGSLVDPTTKAIGGLDQKTALPPEILDLARQAGDQFERGGYSDAEKTYEQALVKVPENLYILSNKTLALYRQRKYELAEATIKKVIAIAPGDDFGPCMLGIVKYQQGKYDDALSELLRALAINPKNATAHNFLGMTESQKGWIEAAHKELEVAKKLNPDEGDSKLRDTAKPGPVDDFLTPLEKFRLKIPVDRAEPPRPPEKR